MADKKKVKFGDNELTIPLLTIDQLERIADVLVDPISGDIASNLRQNRRIVVIGIERAEPFPVTEEAFLKMGATMIEIRDAANLVLRLAGLEMPPLSTELPDPEAPAPDGAS